MLCVYMNEFFQVAAFGFRSYNALSQLIKGFTFCIECSI